MIEIVFGESACGSLKIAQTYGKGKYRGSAVSIFMRHEDGSVPSSDEMKKAQLQAQEQERIAWENECQDLQGVANDESYPLEERDEAAEQLEQLADAGDAYAQYVIGTAYRDGGLLIPDTAKAQKLLERAAEQDLDAAQYALGKLYLSDDADVHDPAKASTG